ncbi:MAG: hypothetical protein JNM39_18080 [Bdellovibrionaceae bacterium]|nr:hypothetical protein [Pseudobdellovibrionaceae bacterium]
MASEDEPNSKRDLVDEGKTLLTDTLKKVFATGVSAAFMTEENIRSYLGELKLPKEILSTLIQSASKSKDEITNRVSKEIIGIVSQIDWVKEIARFAEGHKFKISAEIDIIKKNPESHPDHSPGKEKHRETK